jgi:uncharacterized protein (TIGR02757 family)
VTRAERRGAIKAALDAVRAREDLRQRRSADPVEFVHRQVSREDRELIGLLAATCAFGNVKAIRAKLDDLLARLGPSAAVAASSPTKLARSLATWKHRVYKGEDVARLLIGARHVQKQAGSLGEAFAAELDRADALHAVREDALREALAALCDRIREAGGLPAPGARDPSGRRGPSHLLPDPRAGSAGKRLLLFLRWMVRPDDGIDLGLWDVPTGRLVMPVDVHIHKLARNLGFTTRRDVSWRTAVEITKALSRFDPDDPTRYDFSLCHMGMVQKCPSKRDPDRCAGCGVQPVCVHWTVRVAASKPRAKRSA